MIFHFLMINVRLVQFVLKIVRLMHYLWLVMIKLNLMAKNVFIAEIVKQFVHWMQLE